MCGYVISFVRGKPKCLLGSAPINEMFFCVLPNGADVISVYRGVDKVSFFVEVSYFKVFADEVDSFKASPS